ncbi:MAG: hypothetical protein ACREPI_01725 [Candidatus Dormibacterales bacterium]
MSGPSETSASGWRNPLARAASAPPEGASASVGGRALDARRWAMLLASAALLVAFLGALAGWRNTAATALAVALVVAAGLGWSRLVGFPMGAVMLLVVTGVADRLTFPLGRISLRPEEVAVACALGVLAWSLASPSSQKAIEPRAEELVLAGWLGLNVVSSLLLSPLFGASAKIVLLLAICAGGFVLPRRLLSGEADVRLAVRFLMVLLAGEAAYGVGAFLLHLAGPTVSVSVNGSTGQLMAFGTLWEPNVFGAFSSAGAILWILLGRRLFSGWVVPGLGAGICATAVLVSFTRAAWIAVVAVLVIALVADRLRRRGLALVPRSTALAACLFLVLGGAAWAGELHGSYHLTAAQAAGISGSGQSPAGGGGGTAVTGSASPGGVITNSVDVVGRLVQVREVLHEVKSSPLIGLGTATYGQRHQYQGSPFWLADLELRILYDTGLLGAALFAAFVIIIVVKAWRRRRSALVVALSAAALSLAITDTSTETMELMITWLVLGLSVAAIELVPAGVPASTDA